jgi:hypothetical protein
MSLIHLKLYHLEDLQKACKEHGLTRIYRSGRPGEAHLHYTAWKVFDEHRDLFVTAAVVLPEIQELRQLSNENSMFHSGYHNNSIRWHHDEAKDTLCISSSAKQEFIRNLRLINASKAALKNFREAKVKQIEVTVDRTQLAEIGHEAFEQEKSGGFAESKIGCNTCNGLIKQVYIRITKGGRGGNGLTYTITLHKWDAVFRKLCDKYEKTTLKGLRITPGSVKAKADNQM